MTPDLPGPLVFGGGVAIEYMKIRARLLGICIPGVTEITI
jgi:hypothetical protein